VTAKTYRYLDEEEQAPAADTKAKKAAKRPPRKRRQEREARTWRRLISMTHMKRVAVAAFALALLAGCSDDMDALRAKVTEIKSALAGASKRCRR
jgi:hypothetical protein